MVRIIFSLGIFLPYRSEHILVTGAVMNMCISMDKYSKFNNITLSILDHIYFSITVVNTNVCLTESMYNIKGIIKSVNVSGQVYYTEHWQEPSINCIGQWLKNRTKS